MSKAINLVTKEDLELMTKDCNCPGNAKVPLEVIKKLMQDNDNENNKE